MNKKIIILFISLLFTHCASASPSLPEFDARYAITKFGIKLAEAQYLLKYTDSGYRFSQQTHLVGFASMFRNDTVNAVSIIDDIDGNLLLRKHHYVQTGEEKNRDEDFSIQWDSSGKSPDNKIKGKIKGIVRSKQIEIDVEGPVWEVLSFQIPLMIEASEDKKQYPYTAILKGEVDTYHFNLASTKTITFANKKYKALEMVRTNTRKNRELRIWLVPQLHNLPVIIENYRDGKEHSRMHLESVKFDDDAILEEQAEDDNDEF